jgi:membrane-bound serine protease (ClpP class)
MKLLLALMLWAPAGSALAAAPARAKDAAPPFVLEAVYEGVISPPAAEYLEGAVDLCSRRACDALLVTLDTPGGLDASMRRIVKAFLASPVPVIVYVAPAGARAASAGVFITMAADLAVMAPGTNIGAAHPVQLGGTPGVGGGEKVDKVMETKLANDASAYLSAIAAKRGRNADWAAFVVAQSSSVPAAEAVRLKIVDLQADSVPALLDAADGRTPVGRGKPLRLRGAHVELLPMSGRQRLLAAVSDPNVAMILMTLGVSGLLIELYSPGLVLPGVVGGVSLILAFYSFQTLSAGYAGFSLVFLGMLFAILELKYHSFGLLALAGAISAVFGAIMLARAPGLGVSRGVIEGSVGALLAVMAMLVAFARSVLRRRSVAGAEALRGQKAVALTALSPRGTVRLGPETWQAVAEGGDIPGGAEVRVVGHEGLTLKVRKT